MAADLVVSWNEGVPTALDGVTLAHHEIVDAFLVPVREVRERMGTGQYSHALMAVALFLAERELGRSR